mmetsp:Transcript_20133/g.41034  ORF Transcript_20133/g.41034 Transcript_20133/m.41034 type:complete len:238 (+) Transcript_20133:415-1128(+)
MASRSSLLVIFPLSSSSSCSCSTESINATKAIPSSALLISMSELISSVLPSLPFLRLGLLSTRRGICSCLSLQPLFLFLFLRCRGYRQLGTGTHRLSLLFLFNIPFIFRTSSCPLARPSVLSKYVATSCLVSSLTGSQDDRDSVRSGILKNNLLGRIFFERRMYRGHLPNVVRLSDSCQERRRGWRVLSGHNERRTARRGILCRRGRERAKCNNGPTSKISVKSGKNTETTTVTVLF